MSKAIMTIREGRTDRIFNIIVAILLTVFGIVTLYPLIFVVSASFSEPSAVNSGKMFLLPVKPHLEGYRQVLKYNDIWVGYRNTALYTVVGTVMNVFVTFITAYALSRRDLYGRGVITLYLVFTMWFSGGLIPTFLVVLGLGLVNTPYVMVILGMISMYNCLICRTFIQSSIPYELQEAARIDGCNDFGILWKVVFPLSGPVLAILALYYALGHWNSYFNALIYLNDRRYMTLQIFLREILIQNQSIASSVDELGGLDLMAEVEKAKMAQVMKYSLIVISSAPMLVIYPFVQKFFVKGVMIGSIKG